MSRILALLLVTFCLPGAASARCILDLSHPRDLLAGPSRELKGGPYSLRKAPTPAERADRPLDVLHYDLDLEVSLQSEALSGSLLPRPKFVSWL